MRGNVLAALLAGSLLGACAFTPHEVAINPTAPFERSSVGQGTDVALRILDDREDLVVGQRGVGMNGADITASGVIPVITQEIKSGLTAKGFNVLDANADAPANLEVRLRSFKFFIESGFWAGTLNTNVAMGVEADAGDKKYKRMYRSSDEQSALVVPDGDVIDKKLNAALSDVLGQIMKDDELVEFLVSSANK